MQNPRSSQLNGVQFRSWHVTEQVLLTSRASNLCVCVASESRRGQKNITRFFLWDWFYWPLDSVDTFDFHNNNNNKVKLNELNKHTKGKYSFITDMYLFDIVCFRFILMWKTWVTNLNLKIIKYFIMICYFVIVSYSLDF